MKKRQNKMEKMPKAFFSPSPRLPVSPSGNLDGPVLRILDASANRAREALRVLEDFARFTLDSEEFCTLLKNLRHELTEILAPLLTEAIIFRDTPNDVGTEIKTKREMSREDLPAVITAAGKRLGEALRSLEEFAKIASAPSAAKIESLRYQFYDIEKRLALTLRPQSRFADVKLYVLITQQACKIPWLKAAEQAIQGGADCLQLREKNLPDSQFLSMAKQLANLCKRKNILCIINDRPDIAVLSHADGVHLGQDDLSVSQARQIVGQQKIIGVSTHNLPQARQAVEDGADYIGVGPIFKSPTKPRDFVAGLEYAAQAARDIAIPKVAIAGITAENVQQVLATGIKAVAVTAAVIGFNDVRAAAKKLKDRLKRENVKT
jgi:thiamine-phosphate pyrophosphorylase